MADKITLKKYPKVSFVICTLNCKDFTERCLKSILAQDYPKDKIEMIIVDSYSTDGTIEIARSLGARVILTKVRGYMEGKGMPKSIGCQKAKGEIIITIDSDNKLVEKDWIKKMIYPLLTNKLVDYSICQMAVVKTDPIINQYLSYVGTDPFAIYCSIDPQITLKNLNLKDYGSYFIYNNTIKDFFITGGYYLAFRKETLKEIGGYSRDVDVAYLLASKKEGANIAIVKDAHLHHLITDSTLTFLKKKIKWGLYYFKNRNAEREFKWDSGIFGKFGKINFFYQVFKSLILIPAIFTALRMIIIYKDPVWFIHPFILFFTTIAYILAYLKFKMLSLFGSVTR